MKASTPERIATLAIPSAESQFPGKNERIKSQVTLHPPLMEIKYQPGKFLDGKIDRPIADINAVLKSEIIFASAPFSMRRLGAIPIPGPGKINSHFSANEENMFNLTIVRSASEGKSV